MDGFGNELKAHIDAEVAKRLPELLTEIMSEHLAAVELAKGQLEVQRGQVEAAQRECAEVKAKLAAAESAREAECVARAKAEGELAGERTARGVAVVALKEERAMRAEEQRAHAAERAAWMKEETTEIEFVPVDIIPDRTSIGKATRYMVRKATD